MADYTLPDLPYDYAALEPFISGAIMELHHDKHHATYVKGVNTTVEQLAEAREADAYSHIFGLEKNLSFHLGGHLNHSIFWPNMSPDGGDKPTGELAAAIDHYFGSFDAFRAHFEATAMSIQGSGWSILAWDTLGERLHVVQLYDQQSNLPACLVPLLMLDMWEHAYYLDYRNDKGTFVKQWWNVANWADVQERFERARSQTRGLITGGAGVSAPEIEAEGLLGSAQQVAALVAARVAGTPMVRGCSYARWSRTATSPAVRCWSPNSRWACWPLRPTSPSTPSSAVSTSN